MRNLGITSKKVVVGPKFGVDFAAIKIDEHYLIISSDPITGSKKDIGWFAINICANDVATSGASPKYAEVIILLPYNYGNKELSNITKQIDFSAKKLKISIVGGHTEVTPNLKDPIVIATIFGFTKKFITAAGARENDVIFMTKTAGIEGISILAEYHNKQLENLGEKILKKAKEMRKNLSVIEEAKIAFDTGFVHAMHDATEGGVLGGVYEMAVASKVGFLIKTKDIPLANETRIICNLLSIDPLKLMSSGVLLIAVDPANAESFRTKLLEKGVKIEKIGHFKKGKRIIIDSENMKKIVKNSFTDELWNFFK